MIFVDSVLNLMRRNFKEGVDGLIITQDKLADGQEGEYL